MTFKSRVRNDPCVVAGTAFQYPRLPIPSHWGTAAESFGPDRTAIRISGRSSSFVTLPDLPCTKHTPQALSVGSQFARCCRLAFFCSGPERLAIRQCAGAPWRGKPLDLSVWDEESNCGEARPKWSPVAAVLYAEDAPAPYYDFHMCLSEDCLYFLPFLADLVDAVRPRWRKNNVRGGATGGRHPVA